MRYICPTHFAPAEIHTIIKGSAGSCNNVGLSTDTEGKMLADPWGCIIFMCVLRKGRGAAKHPQVVLIPLQ